MKHDDDDAWSGTPIRQIEQRRRRPRWFVTVTLMLIVLAIAAIGIWADARSGSKNLDLPTPEVLKK